MEPLVALMRRWVVDFFISHDTDVCREIMEPEYALRIGDHIIAGRDEQYVPAIHKQLDQFPGLGMTVHRLLPCGDRIALHFSEHGASGGAGGRVACWSGISLYHGNGERLTGCAAEEDYFARRRQLTTGLADPIDPPAPAPWDSVSRPPDPQAEEVVRRWLEQPWPPTSKGVICDDEHLGVVPPLAFDVTTIEVNELFSSGPDVAFHVKQTGHYVGGLPDIPSGRRAGVLFTAGIVTVTDGVVRSGRIIRDRAGLHRALRAG
jgi:hypothetical protein